jgi:hypothetical protein
MTPKNAISRPVGRFLGAFGVQKQKKRPFGPLFDVLKTLQASTALFRTLARVLFAAGRRAALQADFLAMWRRGAVTLGRDRLGGADVGFDSDFFRHEGLQMKMGGCGILSYRAEPR